MFLLYGMLRGGHSGFVFLLYGMLRGGHSGFVFLYMGFKEVGTLACVLFIHMSPKEVGTPALGSYFMRCIAGVNLFVPRATKVPIRKDLEFNIFIFSQRNCFASLNVNKEP